MKYVFLVGGYGVPKDIFKDKNYNFYLSMVFNRIFDLVQKNNVKGPVIIFSGGKTDMFKPYQRTESSEMKKFFIDLAKREFVKAQTKGWKYLLQDKSLHVLDHFVYLLENLKNYQADRVYIFAEHTRVQRFKSLAKLVLNKKYKWEVLGVDFDLSLNRYHGKDFIDAKEKKTYEIEKWALKSDENMKKYRQLYQDKLDWLRTVGIKGHAQAIHDWWRDKLMKFELK